jgi:hypothetical protein
MKRRRYQADPMAMFKVMARIEPFTHDDVITLTLPTRRAFEAIKNGTATTDQFDELAVSINTAKVRSESIDPLCEEICMVAQAALQRCRDRYLRSNQFGFDGMALQEIPPAIDLYESIMAESNPNLMQEALAVQHKRVLEQIAQKASP